MQIYKPNRLNFALLTGGALLLLIYGIFSEFIFGNKLFLFSDIGSDTLYNYYPIYYLLTTYVESGHFPLWSFRVGAGASILIFYQFLYDPFSIIYFIGGSKNIASLLIWAYLAKICFAGIFSYIYFRLFEVRSWLCLFGALCFAFSGFLLGFGQHYFYASWVIIFPLLLYSIELAITMKKYWILVCVTAYLVLNIAIFWQMAIFSIIYVHFRLIGIGQTRTASQYFGAVIFIGLSVCLGLGLTAVFWIPQYQLLSASPRVSGDILTKVFVAVSKFTQLNSPDYFLSTYLRLYSNNLQGIGSNYSGFLNYYEALQMYCGLIWILVIPQFLVVFPRRERYLAILGICFALCFLGFEGFPTLMNGFQYPSFRWGYGFVLMIILFGLVVLELMFRERRISLSILFVTLLVSLGSVFLLGIFNSGGVGNYLVSSYWSDGPWMGISIFLLIYAVSLIFAVKRSGGYLWSFFLLLLLCFELIHEHRPSFVQRSVVSKGVESNRDMPFFDDSLEAVKSLTQTPTSLFRIAKDHWVLSLNDSMIQGYNALDSYNSLNHPAFVEFYKQFQVTRHHNVLQWNWRGSEVLSDILSTKYLLSKNPFLGGEDLMLLKSVGDVYIYRREEFLEFGFTYDSYMLESDWKKLSPAERSRSMLYAAIVDLPWSPLAKKLTAIDGAVQASFARAKRNEDVMGIKSFNDDEIHGDVYLEKEKLLFLSIPYDLGWVARVNGSVVPLKRVNYGFMGLPLASGRNEIFLSYTPVGFLGGLIITCVSLLIALLLLIRPVLPCLVGQIGLRFNRSENSGL